jgi:hypothetical protein
MLAWRYHQISGDEDVAGYKVVSQGLAQRGKCRGELKP